MMRFSETSLARLTLPEGAARATFSDARYVGLQFVVRPGSRSFHYRFTRRGRQYSMILGAYPAITLEQALHRWSDLRRSLALGEDPRRAERERREVPTLDAFFSERYLPAVKPRKRSWQLDATVYRLHLRRLLGSRHIDEISHLDTEALVRAKRAEGLSAGSVNRIMAVLSAILTQARKQRIARVPSRQDLNIEALPDPPRIERRLTADETRRLLGALGRSRNAMLPMIVSFLLLTGARRHEAMMATWDQIDTETRIWTIPVTKAGKPRKVVLSDATLALLGRVEAEHRRRLDGERLEHVFPNFATGKPYRSIFHPWRHARAAAGLSEVRLHDLRHSFASALVNHGVPIYEVQALLGHASIRTTQRYAHLAPERLHQSVRTVAAYYGPAIVEQDQRPPRR
ncbi:MAG: tyrosine-type recombinase/integrase [Gemmobacter sp.]